MKRSSRKYSRPIDANSLAYSFYRPTAMFLFTSRSCECQASFLLEKRKKKFFFNVFGLINDHTGVIYDINSRRKYKQETGIYSTFSATPDYFYFPNTLLTSNGTCYVTNVCRVIESPLIRLVSHKV